MPHRPMSTAPIATGCHAEFKVARRFDHVDQGSDDGARGHAGEDLVEGDDDRNAVRDAARMHEFGANGDGHRLAGNIFAELADVMSADGSVKRHWITEFLMQMPPKPGGAENAQEVQTAGRKQPTPADVDLGVVEIFEIALELPADESEDHQGQQEFDAADEPALPFGVHGGNCTSARGEG